MLSPAPCTIHFHVRVGQIASLNLPSNQPENQRSRATIPIIAYKQRRHSNALLHIRMFAVHRHLRKHALIEAHRHKWSQALLYLAGAGLQIFSDGEVPIEPGTLVVVPQSVTHAFERTTSRAPLCLIINFQLKGPKAYRRGFCTVNHSDLTQIRQQLAYLSRLQSKANEILAWESAAIILQLLITLLRAAGWLEKAPVLLGGSPDSAIHRLLFSMDLTIPLKQVADRSGYQRDHFNRLVKKETGLSALAQFSAFSVACSRPRSTLPMASRWQTPPMLLALRIRAISPAGFAFIRDKPHPNGSSSTETPTRIYRQLRADRPHWLLPLQRPHERLGRAKEPEIRRFRR